MSTIQIQIAIIINIIVTFVSYVSPFDFSGETYMVVVFDGVTIKERTYTSAKDAYNAKKVFIKVGWSVEVTIINNVFNKQFLYWCMYYHVYVHHYPYMVCSMQCSMHVCTTIVSIHE